jgi:hypothetical protein
MKKSRKIIIGSLLTICMLVILPSVSVAQNKTSLTINSAEQNIDEIGDTKLPKLFPLLYIFVVGRYQLFILRSYFWLALSNYSPYDYDLEPNFALLRSAWFYYRAYAWAILWDPFAQRFWQ